MTANANSENNNNNDNKDLPVDPAPVEDVDDSSVSVIQKEDGTFLVNGKHYEMKSAPLDARFPNQNQTKACFQNYLDFHRCLRVKGEEYEPCNRFKIIYQMICPEQWYEKWDEQIEEGISPFPIDPEGDAKKKAHHHNH